MNINIIIYRVGNSKSQELNGGLKTKKDDILLGKNLNGKKDKKMKDFYV